MELIYCCKIWRIDRNMGWQRFLICWEGLEPEVWIVTPVADESVVVTADYLSVAQWLEYCAIEGPERGELGGGHVEEDVVDRHLGLIWMLFNRSLKGSMEVKDSIE